VPPMMRTLFILFSWSADVLVGWII